jgi:hypothetical protein
VNAVSPGTAKTYSSYWNRIRAKWGTRSLLEPTPTEIKQFAEEIKANAIQRRKSRGGRGTAENFIAALRCIYRHAEDDEPIKPDENPARRTAKPRRQGSVRHALSATQMSEINFYASTTGDDPELDTLLLLRLHTESACRTGGALALRLRDRNWDSYIHRGRSVLAIDHTATACTPACAARVSNTGWERRDSHRVCRHVTRSGDFGDHSAAGNVHRAV